MTMNEDFGWAGDERLIGDCMDDWAMDRLDILADQAEEREHAREELALEFADEKGERDLCDIVREHDERYNDPDYPEQVGQDISEFDEGRDEYLNCDWEE